MSSRTANRIELSGLSVIVTGGSRGIGKGIAEAFLAAGANVMICGRTPPETPPQAGERTAEFTLADVRDLDALDRLVSSTVDRFGRLDVLINNAGGSPQVEAATVSPRFSEKVIALNLLAPLHLSQKANAMMQRQADGGSIINVASISGLRPSPGTAAYGAAKAGLLSLTQSLAMEWAPKVRVNAVTPGLIQTEQSDLHYGDEAGVAAVGANIPLGRMGVPADVAGACLFLASPLAAYVSGASLLVHGGGEPPMHLSTRG